MRHLTRQPDARYRSRDKALVSDRLRLTRRTVVSASARAPSAPVAPFDFCGPRLVI